MAVRKTGAKPRVQQDSPRDVFDELVETETLAEKVDRARGIARELSAATDALNVGLADAEKVLKDIGLGVYASVDYEVDNDGFERSIAFAKVDGEWKIALVEGNITQPDRDTRTPILKCSKEDRFRAAELLPQLVDALIVAAEEQLKTAGRRVREVSDLVRDMRTGVAK